MTNQEKITLLEEMLDVGEGMLKESTLLDDIDDWDSMAVLSLIVLMDEHFNKQISASQIKQFATIKDILDYMQ
jgi:acyl carrier protein